jgi:hypothetical protein
LIISWLVDQTPDFTVSCILGSDYSAPQYPVFKSDLRDKSLIFKDFLEENPGATGMPFEYYKSPLTEQLMPKLRDFIYTGYYAIVPSDVTTYTSNVKIKTKCVTCNNHLRLLCLHKHMFESGRYLRMELLQLLAMEKFARAIEGAQPIVMTAAIRAVYDMNPWSKPDLHGNAYWLAGLSDFRPLFIIHAVVKQLLKDNDGGPEQWTRANARGKGRWKVASAAPKDELRELRDTFPKFDQDLKRAFGVLRESPHLWASYLA